MVDDETPPHMHTEALVCPLSAPFPTALPRLSTRSLPPPSNNPPTHPSPTTPPASPCGQQHPIRPLSLGAAQVMQNSREEHAECELIGLGFKIGAGSLQSRCCFLRLMFLSFTANICTKPAEQEDK
ncbi:hypothetical protein PBY51_022915 [Eleginops maclovinus]|uniref:Uncharacterized protein n=1 Tax=Eleginops maclovinus TaxID=56733 RepID=A0AAN8AMC1_ELEMC|nr:hypothetical protein PBY51_022915 [Eleginops maclovinus]